MCTVSSPNKLAHTCEKNLEDICRPSCGEGQELGRKLALSVLQKYYSHQPGESLSKGWGSVEKRTLQDGEKGKRWRSPSVRNPVGGCGSGTHLLPPHAGEAAYDLGVVVGC